MWNASSYKSTLLRLTLSSLSASKISRFCTGLSLSVRSRRLSVSRERATPRAMRKAVLGVPVRILLFDIFKGISDLAFRRALPSQSQLGYRPNFACVRRSEIRC